MHTVPFLLHHFLSRPFRSFFFAACATPALPAILTSRKKDAEFRIQSSEVMQKGGVRNG
jgi:hypothetical protein